MRAMHHWVCWSSFGLNTSNKTGRGSCKAYVVVILNGKFAINVPCTYFLSITFAYFKILENDPFWFWHKRFPNKNFVHHNLLLYYIITQGLHCFCQHLLFQHTGALIFRLNFCNFSEQRNAPPGALVQQLCETQKFYFQKIVAQSWRRHLPAKLQLC